MSKSTRLLAGLIGLILAFALPVAPLSVKKEGKKREKKRVEKLEQELPGLFKRWLKEDVGSVYSRSVAGATVYHYSFLLATPLAVDATDRLQDGPEERSI